ncbi:siphovirus ReqiPepy6 Gp37-like family protein [Psychrobacillus psychrodurans]|uniref:siphovirus ReqiPepy6 Gp37-like family protein n=1 Tax=Psychrobacillus psychrodurans TaxID=126157 RepID=UPI0008F442AD|nr:siphovirus ReqiPepy6 Gp37-like family protein [Psychrobacillus psychrodurans]MCZ8541956.1 siphovirus ReqiPepy6 Gp37-like family protein [Psychrobacillus psychrodurans]SFN14151.1 virus ReqiPepy6 Gp37-like protein [Psychrobacillus psychrodurans]
MTLPIRIMTKQFELIDEIDQYSSLQITRSWNGIGSIELRINRYLKGADKLVKGAIIFPQNKLNKAYVIRYREIELDQQGKITENWLIKALPLKSWLGQRLTYPPVNEAQDSIESDAESVMLHYILNNAIAPLDSNRIIPNLIVEENLHRGSNVTWQSRYKNLAEEMTEISLLSSLGWNIDIDYQQRKFVFRILKGRNLTINQSVLPPAIFSPEFNTLGQLSYTESELNYRNHAIVAGQGEGVERRTVEVGSSTGFDRYELFVDARDVAEETEGDNPQPRPAADIDTDLINRGEQKLSEYQQETFLEGQSLPQSKLVYGIDYDLGDIVTLQNRDWGVTLDTPITEVKEIYEPGKTGINLTYGYNRPTLISKIKQELSGMKNEMVR